MHKKSRRPTYRRLDVMVSAEVDGAGAFDELEGNFVVVLKRQIQVDRIQALTQRQGAQQLTDHFALCMYEKDR